MLITVCQFFQSVGFHTTGSSQKSLFSKCLHIWKNNFQYFFLLYMFIPPFQGHHLDMLKLLNLLLSSRLVIFF